MRTVKVGNKPPFWVAGNIEMHIWNSGEVTLAKFTPRDTVRSTVPRALKWTGALTWEEETRNKLINLKDLHSLYNNCSAVLLQYMRHDSSQKYLPIVPLESIQICTCASQLPSIPWASGFRQNHKYTGRTYVPRTYSTIHVGTENCIRFARHIVSLRMEQKWTCYIGIPAKHNSLYHSRGYAKGRATGSCTLENPNSAFHMVGLNFPLLPALGR